jgi:transposase InsO family protein
MTSRSGFAQSLEEEMKKARFGEQQIIEILKLAEAGTKVADLCRKHGISQWTFYQWRNKYGGMGVNEAKRLKELSDNGPEFCSRAVDEWAHRLGIKLPFIRPGKPVENAFIESFNGKCRDECLNERLFLTIEQARMATETWRLDYNQVRPHSSLGNLTPED